ncbi:protein S100-A1-like isoform X2 [Pantherophis guttatus]|uniref:Protein S100 n=1 Tax=Pantherophis guttatus TaxID=94885 RepID=A0ABM3YP99_PANGU|nr:protein S100-A1-like isoform X2 [Pantherophis guttatus]
MTSSAMTELEKAIETIVDVFFKYSTREGDQATLTTGEFKELATAQLPNLMKTQKYPIMRDLDKNGDGKVSFQEFVKLVAAILRTGNPSFSE